MNSAKNICYKVYVPVNYEKKDVGIATRISESMKREIDRLADEHDRTPAYVIRELLTRGLALYQADGLLKDDPGAIPERHFAPVVADISSPKAIELSMTREQIQRTITTDEIAEVKRRTTPRKTQNVPMLKQKAGDR